MEFHVISIFERHVCRPFALTFLAFLGDLLLHKLHRRRLHLDLTRKCINICTLAGFVFALVDRHENGGSRALCRIKLLPVTRVLVDTWMLTVKPVYKLLNVSDDLKWTTNTCDTIYTHFQGITNNIYGFGRPFLFLLLFLPVHHISTRPYSFLPVQMTGGRVST